MKIFVNARFLSQPISGVQRYAIECCRKIKKIHPTTVFVAPHNIWNKEVAAELEAQVIGSRTGHPWEQLDLPSWLKKQGRPPLWNPCNTAPLSYTNNYITLHDLAFYHHPEWNSRAFSMWYNLLMPRLARKARHLFTVSNTIKGEILIYYHVPAERVSVTYNGISESMLAAPPGRVPKERIILSVGSFNKRKNHHLLIDAFRNSDIKNTYRLIIIGDKSKVFAETGIDEQQLAASNIILHRHMPEAELIEMYHRAEIVVSLSAYEGFGIPVLEGLYNGCKVVCSDIPVYRELFDGVVSFCDPASQGSVVQAIKDAASGPYPTREKVDQLTERYSYDNAVAELLKQLAVG